MQTYTQRVREAILPRSVGDTLPSAFDEWHFTGAMVDHEQPIEQCELCGQEGLRYHFEIANRYTRQVLQVGSHCILQFGVAVYDGARRLSIAEAQKLLDKLTQQMRLASCIRSLERLAKTETSPILSNALEFYRTNKKLTPKQAFVVFWRLRQNRIDHSPSFFNVTLRKKRYVEDLRGMDTARVHFFWKALTPGQRRLVEKLGHAAPHAK